VSIPLRGLRIGLDVGGTKIAGLALDPDGEIVATARQATGWGDDATVDGIAVVARQLAEQAGAGPDGIRSIGVGIPGLVDADAGRVAFLQALRLDERIEMLPATSPASAVGAALLGPAPEPAPTP